MLLELIKYAVTFRLEGSTITCRDTVEYDRLHSIIRDRKCDIWEPAHKGCSRYEEWFHSNGIRNHVNVSSFTLVYDIKTERNIYLAIRLAGDDVNIDRKDGIELYNMETRNNIWVSDDVIPDYSDWCSRGGCLFQNVENDSISTWMPHIESFVPAVRKKYCSKPPIRTMVELLAKPEFSCGEIRTQMGRDLASAINNRFSWSWSKTKSKHPAQLKEGLENYAVYAVADRYMGDCNIPQLKKALQLMGYTKDDEDIRPALIKALQDNQVELERSDWLATFGLRYFI